MNTGQLITMLMSGMLNGPAPETDLPDDRKQFEADGNKDEYVGKKEIIDALERNELVSASNEYGVPKLWKSGDKYRGILFQYCKITEDKTFDDAESAESWFKNVYNRTYG